MRRIIDPVSQQLEWFRADFHDRMQRVYFRYNVDVPGVLTSIASIAMVCVALSFVFNARGG